MQESSEQTLPQQQPFKKQPILAKERAIATDKAKISKTGSMGTYFFLQYRAMEKTARKKPPKKTRPPFHKAKISQE